LPSKKQRSLAMARFAVFLILVAATSVSALNLLSRGPHNSDVCGKPSSLSITPQALVQLPGAGVEKFKPFEKVLKDGFMKTTCVKDYMYYHGDKYGAAKHSYEIGSVRVSIVHYNDWVAKENRAEMTPKVCFNFCKTVPKMGFFGILNGNKCYCEPYFQQMAGDSSICDATCPGDESNICGGRSKSSIYAMHDCPDAFAAQLALNEATRKTKVLITKAMKKDLKMVKAGKKEAVAKMKLQKDQKKVVNAKKAAKKAAAALKKEKIVFKLVMKKAKRAAEIAMKLHKKEQKADKKDVKKIHEAAEKAALVATAAKAKADIEAHHKAELQKAAKKAAAEAKKKEAAVAKDSAKAKAAAEVRKKAEHAAKAANAAAKKAEKAAQKAAKEAKKKVAHARKTTGRIRSYLTMRVINLNYKKLHADKKLLAAFTKTFQGAVIDGPPFAQEARIEIAEGPIKGWAVIAMKMKPPKDVPLKLWGFSMKSFMGGGIQCMEYALANVPNLKSALDNPKKPAQVEKFKLVNNKKWDKLHDEFVGKFK